MAIPASMPTISLPPKATTSPSALPAASISSTAKSHNEELLQYVERSLKEDKEFHFLRFEKLQRINLVALQMKLIRTKAALSEASTISDDNLENLRTTLEQYATAIQNYHSLRERKSLTYNEATKRADMLQRYFLSQVKDLRVFKSHYSYFDVTVAKIDRLRTLLMNRLPVWITYSRNERAVRRDKFEAGYPPKEVSVSIDRLCRFIIAAIGGLFLVGPMLIMAIRPSTAKSLWDTSDLSRGARVYGNICCCSCGVCRSGHWWWQLGSKAR